MTDPAKPNPYSPFACAEPTVRHAFPVYPFFGGPEAGVLAMTLCERTAIVPGDTQEYPVGAEMPAGTCPGCAAVLREQEPPEDTRTPEQCKTCESRGPNGMCLMCRMDAHDRWASLQLPSNTPLAAPAPLPGEDPAAFIPGFADMEAVYYGVPVAITTEDGDMIALGHLDPRRALAAFNRHARTQWKSRNFSNDPAAEAEEVLAQVQRSWATFTRHTPVTGWAWRCRHAAPGAPGAIPVTSLTVSD